MKFKSTLLGQTSGSLDATVFSRNRGGRYTRVRAIPVNPNTPQQAVIRALLASLTNRWVNTLTTVQRTAWDVYALNVPLLDTLGEPRNVGGIGMYTRSNVPREQAGLPRVDNAPSIFDVGDFTAPTIASVTASTDLLSLNFTIADAWANEDDAAMLVYTARPQNPSINFFKGPYRFAAAILGDLAMPPTSPASIALAFPVEVGQRVFIRVNVTRVDGRLATEFRDFALSV